MFPLAGFFYYIYNALVKYGRDDQEGTFWQGLKHIAYW